MVYQSVILHIFNFHSLKKYVNILWKHSLIRERGWGAKSKLETFLIVINDLYPTGIINVDTLK